MKKQHHIAVRDHIDGPVVREIIVETLNDWVYSLACRLIDTGEEDFTVMVDSHGKASQILTGRHKGGFYCGNGKLPVYLNNPPGKKFKYRVPGSRKL